MPDQSPPPPITSTPPPDILQPPDLAPPPTSSPPPPTNPPTTTTTTTSPRTLRIGTRASALALAQVSLFTTQLNQLHPTLPTLTIPISVAGDRDKTTHLHTLAQTGKSLWTEELEVLLLRGEIDCIVHSLKDVPTKVVAGCEVVVVGERGERRDCVVFPVGRGEGDGKEGGGSLSSLSSSRMDAPGTATTTTTATTPTTATVNGNPPPYAKEAKEREEATSSSSSPPPPKKLKTTTSSSTPAQPRPQPQPPAPPKTLSSLPPHATVGTSSVRRAAMIRRRYPHLRIQTARGNVGTRLRKLDDPSCGFDCLILAGAGVQRVGMGWRVGEWLSPPRPASIGSTGGGGTGTGEEGEEEEEEKGAMMLHAVGQGGIGLEIREGDERVRGLLFGGEGGSGGMVINRTSWECQAERSLLRTLEGGCSVPVGVSCSWLDDDGKENPADGEEEEETAATMMMQPGTLHMLASVTSVDGTECVAAGRKQWVGSDREADEAGWELAKVLVEKGAGRILEGISLNRGMVERGDGA
ncbi:MAG: hypothetical protein Q9219_004236 [cf. Caloplaca sp. 3 TL-2023]